MGSSKKCLPGTRTELLDAISSWVNENTPETPRVALLLAGAGMGKSAIVHSVAHRFKAIGRLAASFVFNRSETSRGPSSLFPTIARHFADLDDIVKAALCSVISKDSQLRTTTDQQDQFEHLILATLKSLSCSGPLLIAIDALDECADSDGRKRMIELLFHSTQTLPPNIRFLVTSRPESPIVDLIRSDGDTGTPHAPSKRPNVLLFDLASSGTGQDSTTNDIFLHVSNELKSVSLPADERDRLYSALAVKSHPSFQFATLACKLIQPGSKATSKSPLQRFKEILDLGGSGSKGLLDDIYRQALVQALDTEDEEVMARFKLLMGIMLTLVEPLPLHAYEAILQAIQNPQDDTWSASEIMPFLGSVLDGVKGADPSQPVRPSHTSFSDFLATKSRSGESFYVGPSPAHLSLAVATLEIMAKCLATQLTEMRRLSTEEVEDEDEEVEDDVKELPMHISYSCLHWEAHLTAATLLPTLLEHFESFLRKGLLPWIQALACMGRLEVASNVLSRMRTWYTVRLSFTSVLMRIPFSMFNFNRPMVRAQTNPRPSSMTHVVWCPSILMKFKPILRSCTMAH